MTDEGMSLAEWSGVAAAGGWTFEGIIAIADGGLVGVQFPDGEIISIQRLMEKKLLNNLGKHLTVSMDWIIPYDR